MDKDALLWGECDAVETALRNFADRVMYGISLRDVVDLRKEIDNQIKAIQDRLQSEGKA